MGQPMIELLETVWSSTAALLDDLAEADWDTPTDLPGWTVRDTVAHMIGTEHMLAGHTAPDPPAAFGDHVRNPIGELNETWIDARRDTPPDELLDEFRSITAERLDALRAMTPDEWDAPSFTPEGEGPYRRFMEIRVFDCWEHEQDIRRATNRPGHLDGPVAAHSIREVTNKLGYIVGKKAGAPDGTTVVFDIVGSLPMVLPVFVDGRARILDREPDRRDVTLYLDTETYNALACGRWTAGDALERDLVTISGDPELGRRVLDNMAFTI